MIKKISTYIALLFLYIALGAMWSNLTEGPEFNNLESFANSYRPPFTFILEDQAISGIFIKTHYHYYKLVGPFTPTDYQKIKVTRDFYQKNIDHLGLSLLCRGKELVLTPIFPGGCFLDAKYLGAFINDKWQFHENYNYLIDNLGWQDFKPTPKIYEQMNSNIKNKTYYIPTNFLR